MKVSIINYGAGNIQSVKFALERMGAQAILTNNVDEITQADRVIFPGVGEASSAMDKLRDTGLDKLIPNLQQPVLGICLGMQLMCNSSEEGNARGLSIFDVDVVRFSNKVKVPQIGWNQITDLSGSLLKDIEEGEYMYLVHSYYAPLCKDTIASSTYDVKYSTALNRDNFYGVQFHPEKSSVMGQKILNNFLKLT
ncbi:imidazole glycerol phosphate synthase subunit HisH [Galbibacter marinus]|uniref:Imidazole glycerol phosphate synthase subunit HisH n=1 Tax=Galbibacter marinus TaxID=555500 RepID=K2PTZ9_9FLAO|nr:imidazole glycerol phosphate synthase subunit HisH [Galbibacter marinus]EKF56100.1 imidazole glycerol phosphate synthase subunit HisH [Galbibacter marinus]